MGSEPEFVIVARADGIGDVSLLGAFDLMAHAELERTLMRLVDESDGQGVRLDLSGVIFLDAGTLGVLARAGRRARRRGARVVVRNLRPMHRRMLAIVGDLDIDVED